MPEARLTPKTINLDRLRRSSNPLPWGKNQMFKALRKGRQDQGQPDLGKNASSLGKYSNRENTLLRVLK